MAFVVWCLFGLCFRYLLVMLIGVLIVLVVEYLRFVAVWLVECVNLHFIVIVGLGCG